MASEIKINGRTFEAPQIAFVSSDVRALLDSIEMLDKLSKKERTNLCAEYTAHMQAASNIFWTEKARAIAEAERLEREQTEKEEQETLARLQEKYR